MRGQRVAGWSRLGAACVSAMAASAGARPLPQPKSLDDAERKRVFSMFSSEEQQMRKAALKDWAADPWSQDDAFHNLEHQRAWGLAGPMNTSEEEVLRALDDGMRGGWPRWGVAMKTTVPPCGPGRITD